jgi:hypothetical protein
MSSPRLARWSSLLGARRRCTSEFASAEDAAAALLSHLVVPGVPREPAIDGVRIWPSCSGTVWSSSPAKYHRSAAGDASPLAREARSVGGGARPRAPLGRASITRACRGDLRPGWRRELEFRPGHARAGHGEHRQGRAHATATRGASISGQAGASVGGGRGASIIAQSGTSITGGGGSGSFQMRMRPWRRSAGGGGTSQLLVIRGRQAARRRSCSSSSPTPAVCCVLPCLVNRRREREKEGQVGATC